MITQMEYSKAYVEVLEILKYMSKKDVNKIPKQLIEKFEQEKDEKYIFKYDNEKKINQQQLSNVTKAILANIYIKYWATEYERKVIEAKQRANRRDLEIQKKLNYKKRGIF